MMKLQYVSFFTIYVLYNIIPDKLDVLAADGGALGFKVPHADLAPWQQVGDN